MQNKIPSSGTLNNLTYTFLKYYSDILKLNKNLGRLVRLLKFNFLKNELMVDPSYPIPR